MFVGSVADNVDQPLPQKIFHARIELDSAAILAEERCFVPIPQISSILDEEGTDRMEEIIRENYYRIKEEVVQIVEREIRRIESDPRTLRGSCRRKRSKPPCGEPAADGHARPAQDDWNRRTFSPLYSRHQPFVFT